MVKLNGNYECFLQTLETGRRERFILKGAGPPAWPLKTTDGRSLSVALTALLIQAGIAALPPPSPLIPHARYEHTAQMGAAWPASCRRTSCCSAFDI